MGYQEYFPWENNEDMLDYVLQPSGITVSQIVFLIRKSVIPGTKIIKKGSRSHQAKSISIYVLVGK